MVCRDAVNDCDIPETCTGDSSQVELIVCNTGKKLEKKKIATTVFRTFYTFLLFQCPHNVHKLDGYMCDNSQVRPSLLSS